MSTPSTISKRSGNSGLMHSYHPPWPAYSLDWLSNSEHFCTLAISSFNQDSQNYVQICSMANPLQTDTMIPCPVTYSLGNNATHSGNLPVDMLATKILWSPCHIAGNDYLGVAGDGLQLWRRSQRSWHFDRLPKFTSV
jgi:hypothetical protein